MSLQNGQGERFLIRSSVFYACFGFLRPWATNSDGKARQANQGHGLYPACTLTCLLHCVKLVDLTRLSLQSNGPRWNTVDSRGGQGLGSLQSMYFSSLKA